jgi:hypothetical protein
MEETTRVQGREITKDDVELVRRLIEANPLWNRTRLSKDLCLLWDWRASNGQLKDMACRALLAKLEQWGHIILPGPQTPGRGCRKVSIPYVPHKTAPIACSLSELQPVSIQIVKDAGLLRLFQCLLARYHYLGFHSTVGENMKYLVFDQEQNPLACLLFGSAAWKCAPRDDFIGWDVETRKLNLKFVTNNMRFLILSWVTVPHLASHILGRVARRISSDWLEKYGHPIYLLETFVEWDRFRGTCYQASNWVKVGQTTGRSRNGHPGLKVPLKDIYLYPLTKRFREELTRRAGEQEGNMRTVNNGVWAGY